METKTAKDEEKNYEKGNSKTRQRKIYERKKRELEEEN